MLPIIDKESKMPLYIQIYENIKKNIVSGKLPKNTKLFSIRYLSSYLGLSKLTIENAYSILLSEGYIESIPRKGYFVVSLETTKYPKKVKENIIKEEELRYENINNIEFDMKFWESSIKSVLKNKEERLRETPQFRGEYELRKEIVKVVSKYRGVNCNTKQVIIGVGFQSLIQHLIYLLDKKQITLAYEYPSFNKLKNILELNKIKTYEIPISSDGLNVEKLFKTSANLVYVSPSHQYPTGYIMSAKNRYKLINWAKRNSGYIIEDDYDGLFKYTGNPISSLQGMDANERIIYFGSFSTLLLPSIRISFMILPKHLYSDKLKMVSQTPSILEQLSLAHFIEEGYLEKHIKKSKKINSLKYEELIKVLQNYKYINYISGSNGQFALLEVLENFNKIINKAKKYNYKIEIVDGLEKENVILLFYRGIKLSNIEDFLKTLFIK